MKTLALIYLFLYLSPLDGIAQHYEWTARIAQHDSISTIPLPEMHFNYFGWKVAIDGNRAAVIAMTTEQSSQKDHATCYMFEKGEDGWKMKQSLPLVIDTQAWFSLQGTMALSGDYLILGVTLQDDHHCAVIYHFEKDAALWQQQQILYAPSPQAQSFFAWAVDINEDYAMVSAANERMGTKSNAGAIYVYQRKGAHWNQLQQLRAADPQADAFFGSNVALSKNSLLVGMPSGSFDAKGGSPLLNAGCAYIFGKDSHSGKWVQEQKLVAKDRAVKDLFGTSVAIQGNCALVGAPNKDDNTLEGAGSVYVFSKQRWGHRWKQKQKLLARDREQSGGFGHDLAIDGNRLLAGSYWRDSMAGCAYIFHRNKVNGKWTEVQKLFAENRKAGDLFGLSVDISSDNLIIGAYKKSTQPFSYDHPGERGEVYIFEQR
jgi:hypothetical protein